jgi:hypothetical protein
MKEEERNDLQDQKAHRYQNPEFTSSTGFDSAFLLGK